MLRANELSFVHSNSEWVNSVLVGAGTSVTDLISGGTPPSVPSVHPDEIASQEVVYSTPPQTIAGPGGKKFDQGKTMMRVGSHFSC